MAILTFLLLMSGALSSPAETGSAKEYQVKAVFLFNFAQFVEWPAQAFSDSGSPLVIGILGDDPFGAALDEVVSGEKINGRAIVVEHFRNAAEIGNCHILFLSGADAQRLAPVAAALRRRNILSVGEADGFSRDGGIIEFFTDHKKIRLKINPEAAKAAGLSVSSKLLRLAEIVTPQKG